MECSNKLKTVNEYKKKTIVVKAIQWFKDGDHPFVFPYFSKKGIPIGKDREGWIDTLDGPKKIVSGDWVVTELSGEVHIYKPKTFQRIYEKMGD